MHELSIANSLVQSVVEALAPETNLKVRSVRLRVGVLAGVVAESLEFCFDVVTRGTLLEGSRLVIETVPLIVRCANCRKDVEIPDGLRFRCPVCDTPSGTIVHGKELEIESVEVEDEVDLLSKET